MPTWYPWFGAIVILILVLILLTVAGVIAWQ
jgi:hypothetical protein